MCRVKRVVWFHSFACGCPVFTVAFIEETVLSLLYILGSSVITQLTICVYFWAWVYFWALYSLLLIEIYAIFMPLPHCSDYCSSVIYFEIREYVQLCFSFSRLLWLFGVFCGSIQILGLFSLFLWKMTLEFL